jgi:hypothetical protein
MISDCGFRIAECGDMYHPFRNPKSTFRNRIAEGGDTYRNIPKSAIHLPKSL